MNAAHPNATPSDPDGRVHEPSMEEILASIRRIIADDQSLPDHAVNFRESPVSRPAPDDIVEAVRTEPAPAAVHVLRPETAPELRRTPEPAAPPPEAFADPAPAPPESAVPDHVASTQERAPSEPRIPQAEGPITPQYATPHGPAVEPAPEARMWPEERDPVVPRQPEPAPVEATPFLRGVTAAAPAEAPEPDIYDAPLGFAPQAAPSLFSAATDQSVVSAFNVLAATRLADNSDELLAMTREMIRPILKEWLDDNLPSMVERLVRAEIERVSRGGR